MGIETNYTDIPITGTTGDTGKATLLYNNDALNNAFLIWISSMPNSFVRSSRGGVLAKHLGKPMNNNKKKDIERDLSIGIKEDFSPSLEIIKLVVKPLYNQRTWQITLQAYSPFLQIGLNNEYYIKNSL